jgi:hypothetical protein
MKYAIFRLAFISIFDIHKLLITLWSILYIIYGCKLHCSGNTGQSAVADCTISFVKCFDHCCKYLYGRFHNGAMTLSIMAMSITTFSIMTLIITILKMTLGIKDS